MKFISRILMLFTPAQRHFGQHAGLNGHLVDSDYFPGSK